MYVVNSRGHNTDPCGTPKVRDCVDDLWPPAAMNCDRPEIYDDIHSRAVPGMPKLCWSRDNKVEWQTVSKAAERSRATAKVEVPASMDLYISDRVLIIQVSVECFFLYADCSGLKFCDDRINGERRARARRSSIFDRVFRLEMGL